MELQKYYNLRSLLCVLRESISFFEDEESNRFGTHTIFSVGGCPSTISESELKRTFEEFKTQLSADLLSEDFEIVESEYRIVFGCVSEECEGLVFGLDLCVLEKNLLKCNAWGSDSEKRVYCLAIRYAEYLKGLFDNGLKEYKKELLLHQETKEINKESTLQKTEKENETLLNVFKTPEAQEILQKTIDKGLCDKHYNWLSTASLWGYYVDMVSKKLNIRYSNDRIKWKLFARFFKMSEKNVNTARQKVNEYRKKGLNPPEGDDIVNEIIK